VELLAPRVQFREPEPASARWGHISSENTPNLLKTNSRKRG
jgi:hypothetical protein